MSKKTIIIILLALVAITGQAQTSFDPDEGCLNVIDISYAQGIGEYGIDTSNMIGCFPNRGAKMQFSECQQTRLIDRRALCLHRCSLEVFEHQNTKNCA